MAKISHWDVARYANTMAVQSTIAIDPSKITVRIKNKLLKWLNDAHLNGGYRSEARKLGELLSESFKLPTTMSTWRGVQARATSPETAKELLDILLADWTAFTLENPGYERGWYGNQYRKAVADLSKCDGTLVPLYIHDKQYKELIIQNLKRRITDEDRQRIQLAIEAIKGNKPIVCIVHQ